MHTTSRRFIFMYVSHETNRPLYVVPDFNSTRRGRDVDALSRERGSWMVNGTIGKRDEMR